MSPQGKRCVKKLGPLGPATTWSFYSSILGKLRVKNKSLGIPGFQIVFGRGHDGFVCVYFPNIGLAK